MELVIILLAVLVAFAFLVAALVDIVAAIGGTLPGDRTHLENLVAGAILIGLLARLTDDWGQDDRDPDDGDCVPLESELPPD